MSHIAKTDLNTITSSIEQYKTKLLKDINLKIRLKDENDKSYITTILKWEGTVLTFSAPLYQRDWVIFPLDSQLECCFVTKSSIYMAQIKIIRTRRTDTELFYKAEIISVLEKQQQRAHFRVDLLLDIYYAVLTNGDGEQLEGVVKKTGTCVNLSVGGMCMVSPEALEKNQHLAIYLNFLDHNFVIPGKIISNSSKNENGTFTHRIQFYHSDIKKENLLGKLIFEKQRMLIKSTSMPLYRKTPNV